MSAEAIALSILSALLGVVTLQFRGMREDLKSMTSSVNELNTKIASMVETTRWHRDEIDDLKERVKRIEGIRARIDIIESRIQ